MSKIYTRRGDGGETDLLGGQRVRKDSLRIGACGAVDELNSALGICLAAGPDERLASVLFRIQNELFCLGSDLSLREEDKKKLKLPQIEERHVTELEMEIDRLLEHLSPLKDFIVPGGSVCAAQLHAARTVCRRAEREAVALSCKETLGPLPRVYLNRLSDLLFVMARYENKAKGVKELLRLKP